MIRIMIRDSHYNHYHLESARITGDDIHTLESYGFKVQGIHGSCQVGFGENTLVPFLNELKKKKEGTQGILGF